MRITLAYTGDKYHYGRDHNDFGSIAKGSKGETGLITRVSRPTSDKNLYSPLTSEGEETQQRTCTIVVNRPDHNGI